MKIPIYKVYLQSVRFFLFDLEGRGVGEHERLFLGKKIIHGKQGKSYNRNKYVKLSFFLI